MDTAEVMGSVEIAVIKKKVEALRKMVNHDKLNGMNDKIIHYTRDYNMFTANIQNRDVNSKHRQGKLKKLRESMQKHGFNQGNPIIVKNSPDGKLEIFAGQGRYKTARELDCGLYYVVDNDYEACLADIEKTNCQWNAEDYVRHYSSLGNENYSYLVMWANRNKLSLTISAELLNGHTAQVCDQGKILINGKFAVGNIDYANRVANIVNLCAAENPLAYQKCFVLAISKLCFVPEFNEMQLIKRLKANPTMTFKCPTCDQYITMLEKAYNYCSHTPKVHLLIRVREVMNARNPKNKRKTK